MFTPGVFVGTMICVMRSVVAGSLGVFGAAHDDEEVRALAVRREPLVTVDDPLVAVAHGRGL